MSDCLYPLPVLERLDDVRRNGNAAEGFDVAAGDGLLIRNDREGFHDRTRIARRLLRRPGIETALHFGEYLETPARRDLHELYSARRPLAREIVEQSTH